MQIFWIFVVLVLSYLVGSIPFGLLVVKLSTGKDIRQVESGRTGGTNAARAAGLGAGIITAVLDFLKAALTVWIARTLVPGNIWIQVLAPVAAVVGHNYSIFLIERGSDRRLRLRGGAGGAPTVGGAFGLSWVSILIILPLAMAVLFGIGFASLATMSVAFFATVIFTFGALAGISPWQYVLYGVITELILIVALRPNIRRLLNGTERRIGWRAKHAKDHSSSSSSSS
jgi:acyl phosphate:glycerol-3-phosphate acyltransferase